MQKMFTDTVTLALIEEDKTKQIIQQEWSKKGPKSFKSLNYQQGSNRDITIIIDQNKDMIDDNVRPRDKKKGSQNIKGTSKADNRQSKISKKCRKLKEIQTKGVSQQKQLERSFKSLLNVEVIKVMIKGFLKGLPNICYLIQ